MRGKIGPSGINDEAPKGRGKRWPSAAFWSQKQTHRKRNKCPTGNPFHHILIYYPFSFSSSNIGKKKNPHLQESKFLFQNTHILSPSHPHIGTARNLHRFSQHFQILRSFHLHAFSATQYFLFYVFKLLLHLNYFFFRKRWKQEGIRRNRFTSQALNLSEITRYTNNWNPRPIFAMGAKILR